VRAADRLHAVAITDHVQDVARRWARCWTLLAVVAFVPVAMWRGIPRGPNLDAGGPLSHAAIVAREFGLPAVTTVRRATLTLRDGDHVEVDGTAGVVRRLDPVES